MRSPMSAAVLAAGLAIAAPVQAADSWGLPGEQAAAFEARVVDVLCELTGDCPADCGGGTRQLGLLRDDGTLVFASKGQVFFAGATQELLPYCGRSVEVDGIFAVNRGARVYFVQYVRTGSGQEWQRADRYKAWWAEEFGFAADAPETGQWWNHDPRVEELVAEDGKLGLGPEADRAFLEGQQ